MTEEIVLVQFKTKRMYRNLKKKKAKVEIWFEAQIDSDINDFECLKFSDS